MFQPALRLLTSELNLLAMSLLGLWSAFLLGSLLIPEIIKIALRYDMHDQQDARKCHVGKIPAFGGVGIFFAFILSFLVWSFPYLDTRMQYMLGGVLVIVIVGMRDDFMPLAARWKLLGQLAATGVLILGGLRIDSLYGFLGIYELPIFWSVSITFFTVVVITNAMNLIDGIDGLAGSISTLALLSFGIWFFMAHEQLMAVLCFITVGAVLAFLRYNFSPAQIFMGDTGSLLLGFLLATLTLTFLQTNASLAPGSELHFRQPVSLVSAILVYPLFDTIRVFVLRVMARRSPFSPDRRHLHHMLLDAGLSHPQATLSIVFVNAGFVALFFFLNNHGVSDNALVALLVGVAWGLSLLLQAQRVWVRRRRAARA